MNDDNDKIEKRVRFGCGGCLGLIIGILVGLRYLESVNRYDYSWFFIGILFLIVFGFLAVIFGDKFIKFILRIIRWL